MSSPSTFESLWLSVTPLSHVDQEASMKTYKAASICRARECLGNSGPDSPLKQVTIQWSYLSVFHVALAQISRGLHLLASAVEKGLFQQPDPAIYGN